MFIVDLNYSQALDHGQVLRGWNKRAWKRGKTMKLVARVKIFSLVLAAGGVLMSQIAGAGGMAVALNSLYLYNNTATETQLEIKNLSNAANLFAVPAHGVCKVEQQIVFQPFVEESNSFVVMLSAGERQNPIVIDQFGLLSLASDSALKLPYSGQVKGYSLLGFCGNKLSQFKYLNVEASANGEEIPSFKLANCKQTTNFVYYINDDYVKVKNRLKQLNFARVSPCKVLPN